MSEEEGVDLIAKTWLLMDFNDKMKLTSKEKFDELAKASPNYKSYQQKARQFIDKVKIFGNNSIGLPQLFKMIADGFKDEENVKDIQGPKIYIEFINILFKRWSREKGQIREDANVKSQWFELNFHKFHQYHALLSLFPKLAPILFPYYNRREWNEQEIIACGIMNKRNKTYYFIHETFREFFVVEPIARVLRLDTVNEEVEKIVNQILTVESFKIVRMFLLPVLNEQFVLEKFKLEIENLIFNQEGFFSELFYDNNDNLVDFAIEALKRKNYKKTRTFIYKNVRLVVQNTHCTRIFTKFQDFLFASLEINDLKNLIYKEEMLQEIIKSNLEIEVFNNFIAQIEAKIDREFIRNILFMSSFSLKKTLFRKCNIFVALSLSSNLNSTKVNDFLHSLENIFTITEIFEIMRNCRNREETILQFCIRDNKLKALNILWTEIEKFYASLNYSQIFKEFLTNYNIFNRNLFHTVALNSSINVHMKFWELLFKTFENREELKNFIMQKDKEGINFIFALLCEVKCPEIIEFTLKTIKQNISKTLFKEILISENLYESTLLKLVLRNLNHATLQDILGDDFGELCSNLKSEIADNLIVLKAILNRILNLLLIINKLIVLQIKFFRNFIIFFFIFAVLLKIYLVKELSAPWIWLEIFWDIVISMIFLYFALIFGTFTVIANGEVPELSS